MGKNRNIVNEYFKLLHLAEELGNDANAELSHTSFDENNKESVVETINFYNTQLSLMQKLLNRIEELAKNKFGDLDK